MPAAGRSSTWCRQSTQGRQLLPPRRAPAHSTPPTPLLPPRALRTLGPVGNSCPLRAPASHCRALSLGHVGPSSSASCVLANLWFPSQPVKNLPVSSAPATSPTPTGLARQQTSRRARTSPSPPPPLCPRTASSSQGTRQPRDPHGAPTFALLSPQWGSADAQAPPGRAALASSS